MEKQFANQQEVSRIVNQMQWCLEQIKKAEYKISILDFKDLSDAQHLLDNIFPSF